MSQRPHESAQLLRAFLALEHPFFAIFLHFFLLLVSSQVGSHKPQVKAHLVPLLESHWPFDWILLHFFALF